MNIKKQHVPKGNRKRLERYRVPSEITIHSTGNPSSNAQNEADYAVRNNNVVGYHYVVDENIIIEIIPPTEMAYHAGDGKDGTGNTKAIGIEMVETGDRSRVIANTIRLVIKLMKEYNIPISKVKRHYDYSKKNCPRILNYNNWEGWIKFKTDLQIELEGGLSNMDEKKVTEIVKREINNTSKEPSKWHKMDWEEGIKLGLTDGTRPQALATREEMITIALRTSKLNQ